MLWTDEGTRLRSYSLFTVLSTVAALAGCGATADAPAERRSEPMTESVVQGRIVTLLDAGHPVFGIFSGDHTAEQGAEMAETRETDFVFYSLESGPFDIATLESYKRAMEERAGARGARPMALRLPPIQDDRDAVSGRVRDGLDAGMEAIVFPHVTSADDAALAVSAMGAELWPANPEGQLVNMLIVEDPFGVDHVDEIVSTPGVSVVFAGPGDLRRAYDGDMDAVETAIQAVLAACKRHRVPCGITAGVDDIANRLEQGFRVIIVTQREALGVGLEAAGRVADR
jgi:2-keto-3-deoxy-L-rhamnonate aldolase RhmA